MERQDRHDAILAEIDRRFERDAARSAYIRKQRSSHLIRNLILDAIAMVLGLCALTGVMVLVAFTFG